MTDPETLVREKRGAAIREMFNSIAPRYDLANHVLSIGIDRRWRARVRSELAALFVRRQPLILDVCCGTGDLSLELAKLGPVVGLDFARDMLCIGDKKIAAMHPAHTVQLAEGDGLVLPFRDETFDIVAAAFGVRNFEDLNAGLKEMARVVRKGGALAVLEFSKPYLPGFSTLFNVYFRRVLPLLGGVLTGQRDPYRYLPASVQSFLDPVEIERILKNEGMDETRIVSLTGGVASLCLTRKQ